MGSARGPYEGFSTSLPFLLAGVGLNASNAFRQQTSRSLGGLTLEYPNHGRDRSSEEHEDHP